MINYFQNKNKLFISFTKYYIIFMIACKNNLRTL
jgi:hypothetical protein